MTFIDAAAIVSILAKEPEASRCAAAILAARAPFTSAIAVWEAVIALTRKDTLGLPLDESSEIVRSFLRESGVELRQLPPPSEAIGLSTEAARNYRSGRSRLNLADCFHYACARHYGAPILSTADEFRFTDLDVVA